jgi:hypothetical protein
MIPEGLLGNYTQRSAFAAMKLSQSLQVVKLLHYGYSRAPEINALISLQVLFGIHCFGVT